VADDRVIRTEGLSRVYTTGSTAVHALRGVDLEVRRGEMLAIMGASGSGKSTLMNLLGCLDSPSGGRYWLDGARADGLDRRRLADIRNTRIGFVFQGFNLLPRTSALDNVELPLLYNHQGHRLNRHRLALEALESVGLGDRVRHEPSELSGGQQQRVAIARALVSRPAILLADEPTGNLDSRTSLEVMALFQRLNREGATILIVTHEQDIAQCATRLVEMRDGLILRDAPVAGRRDAEAELAARPEAAERPESAT